MSKRIYELCVWLLITIGLLALLFMLGSKNMAYGAEGTPVSEKTRLETAPAWNDLFYIVDSSESGATKSKSIQMQYTRLSGVSEYSAGSGVTVTLDLAAVDMPRIELTGTTIPLIISGVTSNIGGRIYYLTIINAGSGAITWESNVYWAGGTEVQPTTGTSNTVDVFPFLYGIEGGSTKYMLAPIKDLK